jgi:hypothetical protein
MYTREALLRAFDSEVAETILTGRASSEASLRLGEVVYNGVLQPTGLAVVDCHDEAAVQRAVRFAADANMQVAVLNGGHDPWGRGLRDNNLVLNVRPIRHISIDAENARATIGGGTLAEDVLAALPDGFAIAIGTATSVGMVGLTSGGGYGMLTSRVGLAADCLLAARVVLADGSVAIADERHDSDLLWALRGGGTGFGVVTEITVALHALSNLLAALVVVPLDAAAPAMVLAQRLIDENPVDLGLFMGFMMTPGGPALVQSPLWSGDRKLGESIVDQLAAMPGAQCIQRRWTSFKDSVDPELEKAWPKGHHYQFLSRNIARLDQPAITSLIASARQIVSQTQAIVLHDFHGTPTQVGAAETAFALRQDHYVVEVIAGWAPNNSTDELSHQNWVKSTIHDLEPVSLPGGYTNLLGPDESDRVRDFYGSSSTRLLQVKSRVDPSDMFRFAIGRLGV